jgi:hypothetical protein
MIRKTGMKTLRRNPSFGPFVRVVGNTIVDSGTRAELKQRNTPFTEKRICAKMKELDTEGYVSMMEDDVPWDEIKDWLTGILNDPEPEGELVYDQAQQYLFFRREELRKEALRIFEDTIRRGREAKQGPK